MSQMEEDWHGLELGFWKTVRVNSFQSLFLLFVNLIITLGIHILFVMKLWFCHLQLISSLTLCSIASKGEPGKLNKLDGTAATQPLEGYMGLKSLCKTILQSASPCEFMGDYRLWHLFYGRSFQVISYLKLLQGRRARLTFSFQLTSHSRLAWRTAFLRYCFVLSFGLLLFVSDAYKSYGRSLDLLLSKYAPCGVGGGGEFCWMVRLLF